MIRFEDVSKVYHGKKFTKRVFNNLNFSVERGESIGIVGANGAGKSTLMRLLAGVEPPTSGTITRTMSMSWPIGYSSALQSGLTGADNARFIARIYNQPEDELLEKVEAFAQLGPYLHQPFGTYSSGMSGRLAFALSLTIEFDCYLIDEVMSAGDERFRKKAEAAMIERRERASLVMISHDLGTLQRYCSRGAVLYGGALTFFDSVSEACEVHYSLQALAS
ncbi:ATP-binding protein [Sphingomonas sp. Leaf17]|uniref:ABC transporter ATP-binding protein n=1 Tax=Sphingomonas sp. Leaf17 TaxID=1735683 RepID=UPI0006F9449D|nr:ABC transporter ATP-binding protein [Sphingomonas sp. Leaf17]KQM67805.1 ATP-binding protein [Sphingomonas sp. Leaf17]